MTSRGWAVKFFGRQIGIHYRILTKLKILMDSIVPHHVSNFFKKRPTDGRVIGDALLFLVWHVPHVPEPKRVGTLLQKLIER